MVEGNIQAAAQDNTRGMAEVQDRVAAPDMKSDNYRSVSEDNYDTAEVEDTDDMESVADMESAEDAAPAQDEARDDNCRYCYNYCSHS